MRFADDFVIGFERWADAERVEKALRERMADHGLTLHPKKTRLFTFRPPSIGGKGSATFDFLGFTLYWQRTRRGWYRMAFKTRRARLRRAIQAATAWSRRHRHLPVKAQHAALMRKLRGHFNYFGVNGNFRSLAHVAHWVACAWRKWLGRRSQRAQMSWERFKALLRTYPLPRPKVYVVIWGK